MSFLLLSDFVGGGGPYRLAFVRGSPTSCCFLFANSSFLAVSFPSHFQKKTLTILRRSPARTRWFLPTDFNCCYDILLRQYCAVSSWMVCWRQAPPLLVWVSRGIRSRAPSALQVERQGPRYRLSQLQLSCQVRLLKQAKSWISRRAKRIDARGMDGC